MLKAGASVAPALMKKGWKMKILFYETGAEPVLKNIESTLEAKKEMVGGDIEPLYLDNGCLVINNEDGIEHLPLNRVIYLCGKGYGEPVPIFGNFFVMSDDWTDYRDTDLTGYIAGIEESAQAVRGVLGKEAT